MKIRLLFALCCVSFLSDDVFADGETEVKKGHYPFMAFIYYPDESIIEATGLRFLRGAVLVKPEWLISSSVGPVMVNGTLVGFPRKTLLARLGSISIDSNFTLNEDEDEQEREVIQLVRPYNHSEAQWWRNDVTLLKTLLPFNLTTVVGTATIRTKPGIISNTNCFMLVYAGTKKNSNITEERMLMQLYVELQYPSQETCGNHFFEDTMLCATDSEDMKTIYDLDFCQGNSGGPLVCEKEVTGLQTYIENNCKSPHLYQLLSAWDNFITCGIEDKCSEEQCSNMCTLVNKDEPTTEPTTAFVEDHVVHLASVELVTLTEQISLHSYTATSEVVTEEYDTPTRIPTLTPAIEQRVTLETTTSTTTSTTPTTTPTTVTTMITTTFPTMTAPSMPMETARDDVETSSWPKEKVPDRTKNFENVGINLERKSNMEAHTQDATVKPRSAADVTNISLSLSLLIQFVLATLII